MKNLFDILFELRVIVVFGDFQTHSIVICNKRGKLSKRFPSTSSKTHKQGTASRLTYDSKYDQYMFECILK